MGPELPCSLINPDEMLRLRNLEIRSTDIEPDDLANLPNLHELTLATRVNRLRDLTPDTFSGMTKLKSLTLELSHPTVKIRTAKTEEFSSNLFRNTPTLAHLRILTDENSPSILLTKEPFRGISPLTTLHVDHIHAIDPDALELLPALRALTLIGEHALEATKQQTLPPDIFKNQLLLQRAQVQGLEFPSAITLASFEAACYAQQWIPKDDNDEPTIQIFVDRQKVDLIKPGPEDKQEGCLLRVGDNRLIEVLN